MDRCSNRSGVGRVREEKVSRKKIKAREEVEKSRNAVLFQCCVSGGSKSRRRPTCSKHYVFEPLLDVQASLFLAGAMILHLAKSELNLRFLRQFRKIWQVRDV